MSETVSSYQGPERVFSGVQPTGNLHLGNYLGAIRKFVDLQHEKDCIFCVVDLHAITVWQNPAELRAQTREIAAAYIAAGIDPEKAIALVVNGFSKEVLNKLPMEFAVEAQKLLEISLEGSVG